MKLHNDLGLKGAGIKLIGPGDITTEEELPNMGDVALGMMTVFHWSAAGERPANKAFLANWRKQYPDTPVPTFQTVGTWDGMDAIYKAIIAQNGKLDTQKTMHLLTHYKNPDSPRGPIWIDPETRDIVQNEYLREVRKNSSGRLENTEIETVGIAVKDPWKEINKKK
jgi:branched-chain amino acid transport system substrate-binding protein